MKNKVIGIIPARMKASRFPGKPLAKIKGMPMIQHVFERAKMYRGWDQLFIATCDKEIMNFVVLLNKENIHERAFLHHQIPTLLFHLKVYYLLVL